MQPQGVFGGYPYCFTVWDETPFVNEQPGSWQVIRTSMLGSDLIWLQVLADLQYHSQRGLVRCQRPQTNSYPRTAYRPTRYEVWQGI